MCALVMCFCLLLCLWLPNPIWSWHQSELSVCCCCTVLTVHLVFYLLLKRPTDTQTQTQNRAKESQITNYLRARCCQTGATASTRLCTSVMSGPRCSMTSASATTPRLPITLPHLLRPWWPFPNWMRMQRLIRPLLRPEWCVSSFNASSELCQTTRRFLAVRLMCRVPLSYVKLCYVVLCCVTVYVTVTYLRSL